MKKKALIFGITGFLIYNTYYDGKYLKLLMSYKKYYTMAMWGFLGLSLYLFIKKHPGQSKDLAVHANQFIKMMPVDRDAVDMLSPIFDMTGGGGMAQSLPPTQKRMMNSGRGSTKRSVSETKKKYVAASQNWCCKHCKKQLPAWFEVDHVIKLEYGGSNNINNLEALCRDCHGKKTALENL